MIVLQPRSIIPLTLTMLMTVRVSAAEVGPPVFNPQLLPASAYASALASINAGFFGINNAYLGSPDSPTPGQVGGGFWVRSSGGTFDTKSSASGIVTNTSSLSTTSTNIYSTYAGVQTGFDLGKYNIGYNGGSVNFGVTTGYVNVDSSAVGNNDQTKTKLSADFNVPFIGAYGAYSSLGFRSIDTFSVDILYRHDFISPDVTYQHPNLQILSSSSGAADTFSASTAYKYSLTKGYFIEPSAGVSISSITPGKLLTNAGNVTGQFPIVFNTKDIDSDLARFTIRFGKTLEVHNLYVTPFVLASLWNEFAGNIQFSNYQLVNQTSTLSGTANRIGTWGQYSIGASARLKESSNLNAFVRADLRSGDKVDGEAITGGLRYQF